MVQSSFSLKKLAFGSKKSHTCEEGVKHLRNSFWHLLMNLKNNYLLKKNDEEDQ